MRRVQYLRCSQVDHGEGEHVNYGGSSQFAVVPAKDALPAIPNWSAGTRTTSSDNGRQKTGEKKGATSLLVRSRYIYR